MENSIRENELKSWQEMAPQLERMVQRVGDQAVRCDDARRSARRGKCRRPRVFLRVQRALSLEGFAHGTVIFERILGFDPGHSVR